MRSVRSITPALQSAPAPSPNTRRSRPPHYRTPLVPARQPPTALHSRPFPHNGVGADTPEVGNPFRSRNLSQPHRQPIERRKTWRAGRRKAPLPAGKIGAENYPRQTNHTRVVHPPRVHSSPHLHVEPPAPPPLRLAAPMPTRTHFTHVPRSPLATRASCTPGSRHPAPSVAANLHPIHTRPIKPGSITDPICPNGRPEQAPTAPVGPTQRRTTRHTTLATAAKPNRNSPNSTSRRKRAKRAPRTAAN